MQRKNKPFDFPYGDSLKTLLERVLQGAIFAYQEGHFQPEAAFEKLKDKDAYIVSGNDVWHAENENTIRSLRDMTNMAIFLDRDASDIFSPGLQPKVKYYSKFASQIQDIIDRDTILDDSKLPLTIQKAYTAFSQYQFQQIDCFDRRMFTSQNKGIGLDL